MSWFTLDFFDIFFFATAGGSGSFCPLFRVMPGWSPTEKRAKPPSVSSVTAVLPRRLTGEGKHNRPRVAAVAQPSIPRRGRTYSGAEDELCNRIRGVSLVG